MFQILQVTSSHARLDVRVYEKVASWSAQEFLCGVLVFDGNGEDEVDGRRGYRLRILDAMPSDRFLFLKTMKPLRLFVASFLTMLHARRVQASIYHLHDPELLMWVWLLPTRSTVFFDAHEDLLSLVRDGRLGRPMARLIESVVVFWLRLIRGRITNVTCATAAIQSTFNLLGFEAVLLQNLPDGDFYGEHGVSGRERRTLCFIGRISEERGVTVLVRAIQRIPDSKLILAGTIKESYLQYLNELDVNARLDFRGLLTREELQKLLASVNAGAVTFLPLQNHVESQPNKFGEYVQAGIPVVFSNFSNWTKFAMPKGLGVAVDPEDVDDVADAISTCFDWPFSSTFIDTCREETEKRSWRREFQILRDMYASKLGQHQ